MQEAGSAGNKPLAPAPEAAAPAVAAAAAAAAAAAMLDEEVSRGEPVGLMLSSMSSSSSSSGANVGAGMGGVASGDRAVLAPDELEQRLLLESPKAELRSAARSSAQTAEVGLVPGVGASGDVDGAATAVGAGLQYLGRYGSTVAMADLTGRMAPETDWYNPLVFVCMGCLHVCVGFALGWPMNVRICEKTGRHAWTVRWRFGSVGCAYRYVTSNRHTFWQETCQYFTLMLLRAYGMRRVLVEACPMGKLHTDLPPFQPELAARWARGEIEWNPARYHAELWMPTSGPDPALHYFHADHSALLIDANVPRSKLVRDAASFRDTFPTLYIEPTPHSRHISTAPACASPPATTAPTPAVAGSVETKDKPENKEGVDSKALMAKLQHARRARAARSGSRAQPTVDQCLPPTNPPLHHPTATRTSL